MPRMEHIGDNKWIKVCFRCNKVFEIIAKTFDEAIDNMRRHFSIDRQKFDLLYSSCHSCESARHSGRENLVHRDDLLELQNGRCALCNIEIAFGQFIAHVDHDHKTGKTRKVLCSGCNSLMGGIDNDEWLAKAIAYRDSFRCA